MIILLKAINNMSAVDAFTESPLLAVHNPLSCIHMHQALVVSKLNLQTDFQQRNKKSTRTIAATTNSRPETILSLALSTQAKCFRTSLRQKCSSETNMSVCKIAIVRISKKVISKTSIWDIAWWERNFFFQGDNCFNEGYWFKSTCQVWNEFR